MGSLANLQNLTHNKRPYIWCFILLKASILFQLPLINRRNFPLLNTKVFWDSAISLEICIAKRGRGITFSTFELTNFLIFFPFFFVDEIFFPFFCFST
ncbi:unnamed protein product, partial [Vitis vinifera]|uniref:Uncharacterized protein n=1 Tax=Vitis vinifera TaxID=29760 RepID=D7T5D6_VITVI